MEYNLWTKAFFLTGRSCFLVMVVIGSDINGGFRLFGRALKVV
jgi:hypothetical protein